MGAPATPLASVLSRSPSYRLDQVTPLAGRCRGTLIHCTFEAHTVEIPPLDEVVLLAANEYRLKRALFDFGWGFRDHFSSHPHPLHVFPAGNAYRWCKDGYADVTLLALSAGDLNGLLDELGHRNPGDGLWQLSQRGFANPTIYQLVTQFMQHASSASPRLMVDSYCAVIANELGQQWGARGRAGPAVRKLPPAVLKRLIDHIKEHLTQDLSLDELAAITGFSKFHFLRCFKASTGRSPLQYVGDLRVAHARRLLERTALPMDAVARDSGFSGADHLARAFGKATGLSPRAYRTALGGVGGRRRH
ncbi:MAG: helix-turn-helix transcriptional regulator [Comamonadaceae bacterium]|uniref:AraC family transcriptional regulator n=1 Tax=Hydrogenophaga borbori TaxID=2294117 RepID=UPI0011C127B1|nr:AraC family transcriptional regulator [Hydrogenophaga borbori]NCT98352.1 helix-turn-helix transcriptional regulator [Comamonadaceae bacterium]